MGEAIHVKIWPLATEIRLRRSGYQQKEYEAHPYFVLMEEIKNVKERIDIGCPYFSDESIAELLAARHKDGIKVRVLVSEEQLNSQNDSYKTCLRQFIQSGVPIKVCYGGKSVGI